MNRFISIGLTIAVSPAILIAIGQWLESPDTIHVSELALFYIAIPLGGLLVFAGLCKTVIDKINPSKLSQAPKVTIRGQMQQEITAFLNFFPVILKGAYNVYKLTKNGVFWRGLLHWILNGCYVVYNLAKNRAFWNGMLNSGGLFLTWLLSQLVPILLTGVLGLFVAGAVYLPIAFDYGARVAFSLGVLSLVYGAESVIRLGFVQTCSQIGFSSPSCITYNLEKPAIVLWVIFYKLWIWRRHSVAARR